MLTLLTTLRRKISLPSSSTPPHTNRMISSNTSWLRSTKLWTQTNLKLRTIPTWKLTRTLYTDKYLIVTCHFSCMWLTRLILPSISSFIWPQWSRVSSLTLTWNRACSTTYRSRSMDFGIPMRSTLRSSSIKRRIRLKLSSRYSRIERRPRSCSLICIRPMSCLFMMTRVRFGSRGRCALTSWRMRERSSNWPKLSSMRIFWKSRIWMLNQARVPYHQLKRILHLLVQWCRVVCIVFTALFIARVEQGAEAQAL